MSEAESSVFREQEHYEQAEQIATELGDVYEDAVSLRNTFAETTHTSTLRQDGQALLDRLENVATDVESILEEIAADTDDVETEYMVREGWELSYHDPSDLPDDLVAVCRMYEAVLRPCGYIDWMFDESSPISGGVPEGDEITAAADRVTEAFPWIATQFESVGLQIPNVESE